MTWPWGALVFFMEWFPLVWFGTILLSAFVGWQANNLFWWLRERRAQKRAEKPLS